MNYHPLLHAFLREQIILRVIFFFNCLFRIKDLRQITASIIKARIIKCVDVLARFHRNSGRIAFAKIAHVSFRPFSCKNEICILSIYQVSEWYCHYWLYAMGKAKKDFRVHLGVVCTSFLSYKTIIFGLVLFAFHTEGPSCGHMFTFSSPQMIRPLAGMECFLCGRPSPLLDDAIQMP